MDVVAGDSALRFAAHDPGLRDLVATNELILVTAAINRLDLQELSSDKDLEIVAYVSAARESSVEVTVELHQSIPGACCSLRGMSQFIFSARQQSAGGDLKRAVLSPLKPCTEHEQSLLLGKERSATRHRESPEQETEFLEVSPHVLFSEHLQGLEGGGGARIPMQHYHSARIMHTQDKNPHTDIIFGGHLMRIAMELAGTAAFAFSGSIPTFRTLDRMSFLKPVKIGSVVNLLASTACVWPGSVSYSRTGTHSNT